MSPTRTIAVCLLTLLVFSAGCGKKGPLYHPGESPEEKTQDDRASTQERQTPPSTVPGY